MDVQPKKKQITQKPQLVRFLITYFMLMGIGYLAVTLTPVNESGLYSHVIIVITHHILNLFQIQSSYQGTVIDLPGVSLNVLFGCNGLEAVMIYSIAVIAFPSAWKKKLIGIAGGLLIIQAINIIRIVGLAYAAVHHASLFKILHVYVAQGIMIAVALGIFLAYLNYATKEKQLAD
jgi:exosortase H (IPTLxxWG-CTERM-specific)